MKILITGGAGFIGANLSRMALGTGHEVRILDDLSTGSKDNLHGLNVDFIHGSLLDENTVLSAVRGVDSVVHLGALGSVPRSLENPLRTHHANATGTLTLLEQARSAGVGHVISASSSSVYGMNAAMPKEEREWVRPMSPYAVSKLATEQYTLAYQQSFEFETLAFRFFNVYGPLQRAGHAYAAVIPTWVHASLSGAPIWVNGDGQNSRDFTYVDTVCNVLLDAVVRRVSHPEPVNLAFGTNTNLNTLLEKVVRIVGVEPDVRYRDPRKGDVPHSMASSRLLKSLFPDVAPVDLDTGLCETVEWMRKYV